MSRRGAAATEFALWVPVLFGLASIVLDWGSYMTTRVNVGRAAMDGVRVGAAVFEPANATAGTISGPRGAERAKEVIEGMGLTCVAPNCTIIWNYCPAGAPGPCDCPDGSCAPPVDSLRVEVNYAFTPWFGWSFTPTTISEEFVMAMESQR